MTASHSELDLGNVRVDDAVRELVPEYVALVLTVSGLRPGPSDQHSDRLLHDAEAEAGALLAGRPPHDLPEVAAWRDAFRRFGAKPQRTRPSVEALLRRVDPGLPRIDRITDAYNAISVRHLIPIGGEDLPSYSGPPRLVRATGEETFDTVDAGAPAVERPQPGEVIWRDDLGVTCRRWNWRQCVRTRITTATTSALFVLDGLPPRDGGALEEAADQLEAALRRFSPDLNVARRLLP